MGVALTLLGLLLIVAGFALPPRAPEPLRWLASLMAPLGAAAALLGVILIAVPDFLDPPPPPPLESGSLISD